MDAGEYADAYVNCMHINARPNAIVLPTKGLSMLHTQFDEAWSSGSEIFLFESIDDETDDASSLYKKFTV